MMTLTLLGAVLLLWAVYHLGLQQGRRSGGTQMLGNLYQRGYLRSDLSVKRVEGSRELRLFTSKAGRA